MVISVVTIQPLVALIAGILILIVPRLLNYVVAIYLIVVGVLGLWPRPADARVGRLSLADLDHQPAAHLAGDDVVGRVRDGVEADRRGHRGELVAVEVAREPLPRLDAQRPSARAPSRCRGATRRAG